MQTQSLHHHPAFPPRSVTSVSARITPEAEWIRLRWRIDGARDLVVPAFAGKGRADNLWRTTCFELFLRAPGASAYVEVNLSPSERWAIYDFSGYREGMAERASPREPTCAMRKGEAMAIFDAAVPAAALPPLPWECQMTAVIEETGGIKSFWALGRADDKPDFHDPACFTWTVGAPEEA
ncbi:hypothetical protein B2G71_18100 [Novosphingobium sp. PC22D]|uniref:DOMON-like domain-containing protein n=1 Tax=Novosphingobium sp. PC22D TaxID=1962403 RepID=UPI000BEF1E85|nr:DOMON-like domain-containing protein [Novosphingobium sp. PC22D]PEQ11202.1 hypothetical protein B2G71_18100 [Novosphingobium sp. PC22D]